MRARLNDRLARATEFPVTLIVAPAGFGKSVALRDFLLTSRLDAVRYDVRREDATLLAFARRLSDALQPVVPAAAASFPAMQQTVMESEDPAAAVCDWFAEHLKRTVCTIVVDDLHFAAEDRRAIAFVAALIDRTCDRVRWILASRSDAGLPVATWLAYGRMDLPVDENELRFTAEEALAAAAEAQTIVEPEEVESLRELTHGWPVALAIALRTHTHASELRPAATREMIYRYLAEQVFARLAPEQREFLLASSVFSSFDAEIVRALGGTAEFVAELRRGIAFLGETTPGRYRYHDLFRDYLESELQRKGETTWLEALRRGAALLEGRGEEAGALGLYAKAGDAEAIVRIVERSGFRLFERGHAETLGAALDTLPEAVRAEHATALGLRAAIDAARGRFDLGKRGFVAGIERAQDDALRFALVHRYALELVRHDRACIELLEPYANDERVAAPLRLPLLGTLATAYARVDRETDARATIERALALLEPSTEDDTRARVLQQAAYVFRAEPGFERAGEYATEAVELALARNLYEVAVRAYSVLYQIAYDAGDDPIACLSILDKVLECARKGASTQARLFGLLAQYGIEAERGDEAALERLDRELAAINGGLPRLRAEVWLPARAMRAGWAGDFSGSYAMLAGTAEQQASQERRAHRSSELAFYAVAAGMHAEAEAALEDAGLALAGCEPTRRALRARITIALAELMRGHTAAAHRHLSEAERALAPPMRWLRAYAGAARTIYRVAMAQAEPALVAGALERLRAAHVGGIARLLEAAPFPQCAGGAYASLTRAERHILELLARGASTKDVAASTERSPRTIDTHIRSICQKLNCSGRRAAVAIATGQGWV